MSCKHEFIQEEWIVEVCKKCDKLRAQTVFEDDLAAANARIAELTEKEEQFAEMKVKNATIELASIKQHKYVGRLNDKITGLYARLRIEIERAESAEAQCAAYKKALDIAMSTNQSHETYCKVEAALEEKLQWRSNDK